MIEIVIAITGMVAETDVMIETETGVMIETETAMIGTEIVATGVILGKGTVMTETAETAQSAERTAIGETETVKRSEIATTKTGRPKIGKIQKMQTRKAGGGRMVRPVQAGLLAAKKLVMAALVQAVAAQEYPLLSATTFLRRSHERQPFQRRMPSSSCTPHQIELVCSSFRGTASYTPNASTSTRKTKLPNNAGWMSTSQRSACLEIAAQLPPASIATLGSSRVSHHLGAVWKSRSHKCSRKGLTRTCDKSCSRSRRMYR
mmetsp:Transcript_25935/g.46887  ORF Transcript_25935/g.46887 Transcript_25935/m.46887 type:complete len:261 (+) Transcript_25935:331-1113(+)